MSDLRAKAEELVIAVRRSGSSRDDIDLIEAALIEAVREERERCAKIAELRMNVFGGEPTTMNERLIVKMIADAIRKEPTS